MLESAESKRIISYRRQVRDLRKAGYREVSGYWGGPNWDETITDCKVVHGRSIFIKAERKPTGTNHPDNAIWQRMRDE